MPGDLLSVPHFQQECDYSCLAACVRMVLAHFGDLRMEADLRALLDTTEGGTRAGNVMRLASAAFEVHVRPSNLTELERGIASGQPFIVFLRTAGLQYRNDDIYHTAVLLGIDATTVVLGDPTFATAPQCTSLESFLQAWKIPGQLAAILRPRKQS